MRLNFLVLLTVLVTAPLAAQDSIQAITEVEPNNSAATATPYDPAVVMTGNLESRDTDYFRFTISDLQIRDIGFELDAETRVDLCLYDNSGNKLKCGRGLSTVFEELRLNGEFVISISPVAKLAQKVPYRLSVSDPRPVRTGFEIEPNDRWDDAIPLAVNSTVKGRLVGGEYDSFDIELQGPRQIWSIIATGDVVYRLELRSAGGIAIHQSSNDGGETRMDNLQLPQGRYSVRLTGDSRSDDRKYRLTLAAFGTPDDVTAGDLIRDADASLPDGIIEAEPNNTNGQADRLSFGQSHIGMLTKSDTDMYRFYLPGHGKVRIEVVPARDGKTNVSLDGGKSVRSKSPDDVVLFTRALLPGDHYLSVRSRPAGKGFYRLTMTQLDPLALPESKLDHIEISVPEILPSIAAYTPIGQQMNVPVKIKNNGPSPANLEIVTRSSAYSWQLKSEQSHIKVASGESAQVDIALDVFADARADIPTLLSFGVRDETGNMASDTAHGTAACEGLPLNPVELWPLPEELLGHINAASQGIGATVVEPQRRDTDAFDGVVSRSRGAWGRADDTITIDLAGDKPLTVLGTIVHPAGSSERDIQLRQFEILTSVDGITFTSSFFGELTADAVEQAFVFESPISARFAKIRLISNQSASKNKIGLGEWKVIVGEAAHEISGEAINVADYALGGYDVFSVPYAGSGSVHDPFSTSASDGHLTKAPNRLEWVMAFHENRAALITELRWNEANDRRRKERDLSTVHVAASMASPLGPWQDIGEWSLERGESGVEPLVLEAPLWARFVRFTAPPLTNKKPPNIPQQIHIIEQAANDSYQSIIGEWGYTNRDAIYESLHPLTFEDSTNYKDAADVREQAAPLAFGSIASGDVLVEEDVDWYSVEVPEGSNQLTVNFIGNPGVEYAFEVQNAQGERMDAITNSPANSSANLTIDVTPGRYFIKLHELPRSIIFAWDTSGSVGKYYDVIDQTMKTFAAGVSQGREEVNLQPFSDPHQKFLLEDWSGDTQVVSSGIVNSDRKFSSSNVESALLFSSRELRDRVGTRAVMLITDAETDGHKLTDALWTSLKESRPRVFSFEISSAGSSKAQNLMQSYAEINNGFYDQALSAGELQVGFDRAICMLRRPKRYHISAQVETVADKPDGQLLVELETTHSQDAVEVILDASGSMYKKLAGRFRYEIAKDVLKDLVNTTLPDHIGFALRVFGNRDSSSCRTDLEIELAPLDRDKAQSVISAIKPREFAYTPIADSLAKVASDLAKVEGRKTVVLVTDGEESCDGNVEEAIKTLNASGIDVQLNVIGFDFDADDKAAARETFRQWADMGNGEYFDASNADELSDSLNEAISTITHYTILTMSGNVVVPSAAYGESVSLSPGKYRLQVPGVPHATGREVVVRSTKTTTIQLKP